MTTILKLHLPDFDPDLCSSEALLKIRQLLNVKLREAENLKIDLEKLPDKSESGCKRALTQEIDTFMMTVSASELAVTHTLLERENSRNTSTGVKTDALCRILALPLPDLSTALIALKAAHKTASSALASEQRPGGNASSQKEVKLVSPKVTEIVAAIRERRKRERPRRKRRPRRRRASECQACLDLGSRPMYECIPS